MKPRRILRNRNVKKSILIVTQGEVTEPEYFRYFRNSHRINSLDIKILNIKETDAFKLAKQAINQYSNISNDYDECWLVFDKDENSDESFNSAILYAKKKKWHVAYSNQAFEYWLILHFERFHGQLHRKEYKKRLTDLLGFEYLKNEKKCINKICALIESKIPDAINNAEKILSSYDEPRNPAREESSSTVHILVDEIRKYFILEKSLL